jgi:hypothetical protein
MNAHGFDMQMCVLMNRMVLEDHLKSLIPLGRCCVDCSQTAQYPPRYHMQHSTMWLQRAVGMKHTFCAKSTFEIFLVVGTQPKLALVDTFSHASCKNRQNAGKRSTFPTT